MEPWAIAVLVISIIIAIYLMIIVVDIVFILIFRTIFKKHDIAVKITLMRVYDNVKTLIDILVDFKVPLSFKYIKMFQDINPKCFDCPTCKECRVARETFGVIKNEVKFVLNDNPDVAKHSEITLAINSIKETDLNLRSLVGMYNADVLGYNYWIHFLPTRWIWKKAKPKDMM